MPSGQQFLLPRVGELASSNDERVAHQARLSLFQLDPDSRGKLFEPLLANAVAATTLGRCLEELTVLYRTDETKRAIVFAQLMELTLDRIDADGRVISDAVADLGGNVTQHLLAACEHRNAAVRLQGITTLERFEHRWLQGRSYVQLDGKVKGALLAKLKKDPSSEVRRAAEVMGNPPNYQGPSGNWGTGSGYTGGTPF
jgi:hypothetical protein